MENTPKISVETIVRTILLLFTFTNSILVMFGKNPLPISQEEWYIAISSIVTAATTIWAWWKNNDITKHARRKTEFIEEFEKKNGEL